jgi:general secretion pathway protein D
MRQAERHVTVVGDEQSNSVLVGVSPRFYSRTMEMLYSIDRPPPQVSIQVLIAEVALNDRLEFGMEWALQDLLFSENATVGPNGVVQGHDMDFVGGTDLGAAGSFGGFSFAITGEDFNFLLHALQSDGSLEVLSRPSIMVENNEEANITIGDRVPFVSNSSVSDAGQITSTVQYEDVGIILDVTPHINPDGYVNLEISPEISSLNEGSGVPISEGFTPPTFSNRKAETVVTVKDGETIVVGGLIQTQESSNESKVPIIGDIPFVGNLFRATTNTRRRTELIMVLTVNIVHDEHDAFVESVKLRDQSGFLPERMKRSPLMGKLRILPGDTDATYPVDDVRSPETTPTPDLPLYGPMPGIYGPIRPGAGEDGPDIIATEAYGPPRVSSAIGVDSTTNVGAGSRTSQDGK